MTKTPGFPWIGLHRGTVVRILHTLEIDGPGLSDQIEQIIERIAPGRMGKFIRETLNPKRVIDVRHRAQPTDAHMSFRGPIFDAKIWQIVRNICPALLEMGRVTINRVHIKYGKNRRKLRSLQARSWFAVRPDSRLHNP